MSATVESTKFANYFERPLCGLFRPAPIINIEQKNNHELQIYYLDDLAFLKEVS